MKINKSLITLSIIVSQSLLFGESTVLEEIKIEEKKNLKQILLILI